MEAPPPLKLDLFTAISTNLPLIIWSLMCGLRLFITTWSWQIIILLVRLVRHKRAINLAECTSTILIQLTVDDEAITIQRVYRLLMFLQIRQRKLQILLLRHWRPEVFNQQLVHCHQTVSINCYVSHARGLVVSLRILYSFNNVDDVFDRTSWAFRNQQMRYEFGKKSIIMV